MNQVAEMRDKLEAFSMSAVTSFPVPPTELLKFVEYPFTVSYFEEVWVCVPCLWVGGWVGERCISLRCVEHNQVIELEDHIIYIHSLNSLLTKICALQL